MAAPNSTTGSDWQPRLSFGMLRHMARTFGSVVTRKRRGKTRYGLRFRVDGDEYYSWSVPLGERNIPYSTQDLVEGILDEIRGDVRRGVDPIAAISPYLRNSKIYEFEKFWDEWIDQQQARVAAGQLSNDWVRVLARYSANGYLDPILHESIYVLDYDHMETLQAHLFERGLSPKTVKQVLTSVRTCLRRLARRRGFPPAPDIPETRQTLHVPVIPSIKEQRALLEAIPWNVRGYFLARGTLGVRDEEAARANLEDYRYGETPESDSWHIRAKGGRDRLLPVPSELAQWVRAHHRIGPSLAGTPLFTNPDSYGGTGDGRWTKSARRRAMLKAMQEIGKPGAWSPNEALRHCYGTRTAERLLRDGNRQHDAMRLIMTIMWHTSAETSGRYIQLATECLREGVE